MAAHSVAPPCLPAITVYLNTTSRTNQSQFPTHVYTFLALDDVTGQVVCSNVDAPPKLEAGHVHLGYHKGLLDFLMRFPDCLGDRLSADKKAGIQRDAMQILSELGQTRLLTVISAPGAGGIMHPYSVPLETHLNTGFAGKSGQPYADAAWVSYVFLKAEEARLHFYCRAAETGTEKAQLAALKKIGKQRYERAQLDSVSGSA